MQEGQAILDSRARQRAASLAMANMKRTQAAELKRRVRRRESEASVLLRGGEPEWQEALEIVAVKDLLMAIPRFGVKTANEVMVEMDLTGALKVQHMSMQRRHSLANLIDLVRGKMPNDL